MLTDYLYKRIFNSYGGGFEEDLGIWRFNNFSHKQFNDFKSHHMKWYCEESGYVLSYPLDEPMNKPVFCTGCGKQHIYKPGELSDTDHRLLEEIRLGLQNNKEAVD